MKANFGFALGSVFTVLACATGQPLQGDDPTPGEAVDAGLRRDSSVLSSGGQGGDTKESGGAPPGNGSAMSGTGGAGTGGSSTGGVLAANGGAASMEGAGGTPQGSGGDANGNGGAASGNGGACAMSEKPCAGACVTQAAMNGCSATSCTACPIPAPANGIQICDANGQCDFECLSGYTKNGNQCGQGPAAGGSSGAAGSSGAVMCGHLRCLRCLGNDIGCCDKNTGNLCLCVSAAQQANRCR